MIDHREDWIANLATARRRLAEIQSKQAVVIGDDLSQDLNVDRSESGTGASDQESHQDQTASCASTNHDQDVAARSQTPPSQNDLHAPSSFDRRDSMYEGQGADNHFGHGDLVVVSVDGSTANSWSGKVCSLSGQINIEVQKRTASDGPLAASGPIVSGIDLANLCHLVESTTPASNKARSLFGHFSLKYQGHAYYVGLRHSRFGNFCIGQVIEPGKFIIAGFIVTASRPHLKVLLCTMENPSKIEMKEVGASEFTGTFVYFCLLLFTFVYFCLLSFTFV